MAQVTVCDRCGDNIPAEATVTRVVVAIDRARAEQEYDRDTLSQRTWELDPICAGLALDGALSQLGKPSHEWTRREATDERAPAPD